MSIRTGFNRSSSRPDRRVLRVLSSWLSRLLLRMLKQWRKRRKRKKKLIKEQYLVLKNYTRTHNRTVEIISPRLQGEQEASFRRPRETLLIPQYKIPQIFISGRQVRTLLISKCTLGPWIASLRILCRKRALWWAAWNPCISPHSIWLN